MGIDLKPKTGKGKKSLPPPSLPFPASYVFFQSLYSKHISVHVPSPPLNCTFILIQEHVFYGKVHAFWGIKVNHFKDLAKVNAYTLWGLEFIFITKWSFRKLEIKEKILIPAYLYVVHHNDEEENYSFYWLWSEKTSECCFPYWMLYGKYLTDFLAY